MSETGEARALIMTDEERLAAELLANAIRQDRDGAVRCLEIVRTARAKALRDGAEQMREAALVECDKPERFEPLHWPDNEPLPFRSRDRNEIMAAIQAIPLPGDQT